MPLRAHEGYTGSGNTLWPLGGLEGHQVCKQAQSGLGRSSSDRLPQALSHAMGHDWRWCSKCNRAKPPLCHHCSVCRKWVARNAEERPTRQHSIPV